MVGLFAAMFIWFIVLAFRENEWRPLAVFLAIWAIFSIIGSLS